MDLGSGTGLSSRWCSAWAARVVGVEPSDDMRAQAEAEPRPNVAYVAGWSHATGLPAASADVVLTVQALHWMEPDSTFAEVARILRPGGVFAALDCDWPPSVGSIRAERAWDRCRATAREREAEWAREQPGDEVAHAWAKSEHLARMVASGRFADCRELGFHTTEDGDADRFVDLLLSQGELQTLRRHGYDDTSLGLDLFRAEVHAALGEQARPFWFTYRMRLGVAPA